MKIVMVGPFGLSPKATMSTRALPLAQALVRRGHAVHLLLPPWSAPADSGCCWTDAGVAIEHVALPPAIPGLFEAGITARLARRVAELRPDVVHYFKPKAYPAFVAALFRWRRRLGMGRARLVLDTDDWEGPGGWNDVEPYGRLARALFAWQERHELARADAVTVASRALETLAWSAGAPAGRVIYLPNGVRPPLRAGERNRMRAQLEVGQAPLLLLYTRFAEFTLADLKAILAQVAAAVPDVHMLVVGRGLRGEEEALPALLGEIGLGGRLRRVDWQGDLLPDHLAAADAALFPYADTLISRCKCSVKLGELLAHGVPVAASAVGENMSYIEHGVSGLLAAAGDLAGLAGAAAQLLADRGLAARLGRAGRERMATEYSWDRLAAFAELAYRRAARD